MNPNPIEHFSQVIEKLSKNKLNKSNAFENRIIDSIEQLICEQNSNDIDWNKYSAGVDGCGIIYAFCVDSLHSDLLQILSGLNLNLKKENEEKVIKSKTRVINGTSTLEKNENISNSQIEKNEKTDFLFKSYSKKLDCNNYAGLLMNSFSINSCMDFEIHEDKIELKEILPEDQRFEVVVRDLPKNEEIFVGVDKIFKEIRHDVSYFEEFFKDILDNGLETVGFQENQVYIEENRMDEVDLNENNGVRFNNFQDDPVDSSSNSEDSDHETIEEPVFNLDQKLVNLVQMSSSNLLFSTKNNLPCSDFLKSVKRPPLLRKKNLETPILLPNISLSKSEVFKEHRKGYFNSYSSSVISNMKENLSILHEDFQYTSNSLTSLYNFPVPELSSRRPNQENPSFSASEVFFSSMEPEVAFESHSQGPALKSGNVSLVSKTVNIKKLKEVMWMELCEQKENCLDMDQNQSFLGIVKQLPRTVCENDLSNLSVHTCFIALLHLANEKNLQLLKKGECDFLIKN
jgi:hypothetical protein